MLGCVARESLSPPAGELLLLGDAGSGCSAAREQQRTFGPLVLLSTSEENWFKKYQKITSLR